VVEAAPAVAPVGHYAVAGSSYGFCRGSEGADQLATDAAKWITAVRSTPDYSTGRLVEVATRPCPKFDALLDQLVPSLKKDSDNATTP